MQIISNSCLEFITRTVCSKEKCEVKQKKICDSSVLLVVQILIGDFGIRFIHQDTPTEEKT